MADIGPKLKYETYQDIKNNLLYWVFIQQIAGLAFIFFVLLDSTTRQSIYTLITSVDSWIVETILSIFIPFLSVVVSFGIAYILIFAFEIHDKFYDKYIIQWRKKIDTRFILPKLTHNFRNELPSNFLDRAERYRYEFMGPYFDYVGDHKEGIEQNTRIRFYERIFWYWVTQLNEMFLLFFIIGIPIYVLVYNNHPLDLQSYVTISITLYALVLINRYLIKVTRSQTERKTIDEINEIISKPENIDNLKNKYLELCKQFS